MSVTVQTMPAAAAATRQERLAFSPLKSDRLHDPRRQPSSSRRPLPGPPSSFPTSLIPTASVVRAPLQRVTDSDGLSSIFVLASVLERFAKWLGWRDWLALSQTGKAIRTTMLSQATKDKIFSHLIPGYGYAVRLRNAAIWEDVIRLDYADMGLLLDSLDTPLHLFPKHSLLVLSSEHPSWQQVETTKRLQLLCQAHSRVVLLLQNMVHSCGDPLPSDLDDPTLRIRKNTTTALRELTFPAPLSYFKSNISLPSTKRNIKQLKGKVKSKSTPPSIFESSDSSRDGYTLEDHRNKSWNSEPDSSSGRTGGRLELTSPRAKRLSIFGSPKRPPPRPSVVPDSLRIYSGNWRRSYYVPGSPTEDGVLKPPKRRFATLNHSSESSLASASSSDQKHAVRIRPSSPHDLQCALERSRAPILRVFVPCSTLCEDVITLCENQLVDHGLWQHLSVGDVVCNFGYVPLPNDAENGRMTAADRRLWLIFNGESLEVFESPSAPPIPDALSLPSPFYFKDILPANVNPRFRFAIPAGPFPAQYQFTRTRAMINSPHSTNGHVRVNTFSWLANIDAGANPHPAASIGWRGVWTIESEGTVEGYTAIQSLFSGSSEPTEFEIDLEKSGEGRLWLRMHRSVYPIRELDNLGIGLRTA